MTKKIECARCVCAEMDRSPRYVSRGEKDNFQNIVQYYNA